MLAMSLRLINFSTSNYTRDLLTVAKFCVEPATLFGWSDNRITMHQCATDSPEQHSSDFNFRDFLSLQLVALLQQEIGVNPTILHKYILLRHNYLEQGCPRGVIVKALDCGIVVSKFKLQSCYYVHFRTNTLGKGMNPLILSDMG